MFDFLSENLKKIFSFHYDDRPMDDSAYEFHEHWIRLLHDYYLRVEHIGQTKECRRVAKRDSVILISNHVIALEAAFIGYYFLMHHLGKIGILVYPEAFKLPLVREFFRSAQCIPISVEAGVKTLQKKHVLLFPEGMDFINALVDQERIPKFHKGFLRIAKNYLEKTGKKSVNIIPVGHAGMEETLKFWVIKDQDFLDLFIRPFANYPFWIIPKIPFLLPSKVVMNWGAPVKLTLKDLEDEKKMTQKANLFRRNLLNLRNRAKKVRGMKKKLF